MTSLRKNIVANFAGQGAATLIQLAITPVYIRWLGVEAYGLVGFQVTLQALMQVLDFGLSPTINRELARYSVLPEKAQESRDFVRTLEVGYWVIGMCIGLLIYVAAPYISLYWLNRSSLPAPVIQQSLRIIAALIAAQWPLTFYQGGLLGLQRHSSLNAARVLMTAAAAVGGYLTLVYISPTITAFLWWQAAVSLIHVVFVTALLWWNLPKSERLPRIRLGAVRHTGRFAAGMTAITITALVLTQIDRVVLSRVVSLEQFGYYVVGGLVGTSLYAISRPMFASLFPKFSALAAAHDHAALDRLYRQSWRLALVLIVPISAVIAAFSHELLLVWTDNVSIARAAGPIASFLIIGTAFHGLSQPTYAVQLAYGWTRLTASIYFLLILIQTPAILMIAPRFGTIGVSVVWPAMTLLYLMLAVPLTHRKLLPAVDSLWLLREVLFPTAASILSVVLCRFAFAGMTGRTRILVGVAATWAIAEVALVASSDQLRGESKQAALRTARYARARSLGMTT